MDSTSKTFIKKSNNRLKFIDMARSVAILLMLEGHFVDDSLALEFRDLSNPIYYTWRFIRSFTAPMFLTVTGIIFTFLLLKNRELGFWQNIRVKKGYKRVLELFFWGFVVQYYAFHVLECIAVGIFTILLLYGIYKIVKLVPLWIYFFIAGFFTFSFYLYLEANLSPEQPWPEGAWSFVQKAFHGKKSSSIFPIVPYMGYTMFGAAIGSIIYRSQAHVRHWSFPVLFLGVGAALFFSSTEILSIIDIVVQTIVPDFSYHLVDINWLIERLGIVLIEMGVFITIDILWGEKFSENNLFLKIGQNTLTIYVLHMVLLYGSVSGLGLNKFFRKALNPWEVTIGAILFIAFFVILIKYIDVIRARLSFILVPLRRFFERIFFI